MVSDLLGGMAQWSLEVVYSLGYLGVFALMALSNLLLPIPSELVLPLAGFLVGKGQFSFSLVFLASTAGALAGGRLMTPALPRAFSNDIVGFL